MIRWRREQAERKIEARVEELRAEGENHPAPEEIVALIEHGIEDPDGQSLRDHLSRCRRCFALYSELVHVVTDSPHVAPGSVPQDWARLGRSVAPSAVEIGPAAWLTRRRTVVGSALAAAAILAIALGLILRPAAGPPSSLPTADTEAILAALPRVIPEGWVVPGLLPFARDQPVYRSDEPLNGRELEDATEHAIEQLVYRYEEAETPSEEVSYWLASGHLAAGHERGARVVLDVACQRYPGSARLAVLQALLAYRKSSLDDAEAVLRRALEINPRDPVLAIDRAVVLSELDRTEESRELLQGLAGRLGRTHPLRKHVNALHSAMSNPTH